MFSASYAPIPQRFGVEALDDRTIRTESGRLLRSPFPIERFTIARRSFTVHVRLPYARGMHAYLYRAHDGARLATVSAATDAMLARIDEDRLSLVLPDGTRARFGTPISLVLGDARGAVVLLAARPGDGRNLYRVRNGRGVVWRVGRARTRSLAFGYETAARHGSEIVAFAPHDRFIAHVDPRTGEVRTTRDG